MGFWKDTHAPLWPLTSTPKKWTAGGSFGASRDGGSRTHQGVDLYAAKGAPVVAVEDGTVTMSQGWSGSGTRAIFVDHPKAGITVLYGAVAPKSYKVGSTVKKGQKLAEIGVYPKGSHMLHLETYPLGTTVRKVWYSGDPPDTVIDPSDYLEAAMGNVVLENPQDSKTNACGGDVSADDGALTLDHPCSIVNGVEVCSGFNISSWQTSLKNEIDALKGLVIAAETAGKKSLTKGTNYTLGMGETILDKWGLFTFTPGQAVAETSEAARRVRCERLELEAKLAGQQPPKNGQQGQGGQGNGGQQKPPASGGGGGAGLALGAAAVIGVGLLLRRKRK